MRLTLPPLTVPSWVHTPRFTKVFAVLAAGFGGFATVAILVAVQNAGAPIWAVNAAMLTPGVITAIMVPSSRRRWYRWVAILVIAQVINEWATAPYLLAATSWALWRSWSVERPTPATPRTSPSRSTRAAHTVPARTTLERAA